MIYWLILFPLWMAAATFAVRSNRWRPWLLPAGALGHGRFHCTACGNAINVRMVVPRCKLCGERLWERDESSPYARVT